MNERDLSRALLEGANYQPPLPPTPRCLHDVSSGEIMFGFLALGLFLSDVVDRVAIGAFTIGMEYSWCSQA